ncbi:MAG TPA: hypothetical protein VHS78_05335 [Candidatus Elarobacter sp.]|jgi:hypothetical protein|nr:hypothetical protein [Candidatus Elarobacter sp.]
MKTIAAPLVALALLGAAPSPAPSPSASPAARTLTVTCRQTPLYVFVSGSDRPVRARTFSATQGQRFGLVRGPRTTLESFQYYETDVPVAEPGYGRDAHYWINSDCVALSR